MKIIIDFPMKGMDVTDVDDLKRLEADVLEPAAGWVPDGVARFDLASKHAWINLDWLERTAGAGSSLPDWPAEFRKMIDYARSKEWVDIQTNSVRVHCNMKRTSEASS